MGADGGINWVNVTGDKDEFYKLIRPFGLLWGKDSHDEQHDEYLEKYPLPKPKVGFYEISTYGSFNLNDGMDDLRDLIEELRWYMRPTKQPFDSVWGDTNPLELTWAEMLTEYHTADHWKSLREWNLPAPMKIMVSHRNWVYDPETDKITQYDDPIYYITLREWLGRIRKVVDVKSFGSAETWT